MLHSERFCDVALPEVWATLIDEGTYLGSVATMYRVLRELGETGERRRQRSHPATVIPELVATAPNQCWSWDIAKLLFAGRLEPRAYQAGTTAMSLLCLATGKHPLDAVHKASGGNGKSGTSDRRICPGESP